MDSKVFRQYAKEAMEMAEVVGADRQAFIDLAITWMRAHLVVSKREAVPLVLDVV